MATKEKVEATTAVTEGAKAQKLDYTDWLLVDLRAELERRGSDKKGTKRALAMRLEGLDGQLDAEYDSSQSNEEPSPPSPPPRPPLARRRNAVGQWMRVAPVLPTSLWLHRHGRTPRETQGIAVLWKCIGTLQQIASKTHTRSLWLRSRAPLRRPMLRQPH